MVLARVASLASLASLVRTVSLASFGRFFRSSAREWGFFRLWRKLVSRSEGLTVALVGEHGGLRASLGALGCACNQLRLVVTCCAFPLAACAGIGVCLGWRPFVVRAMRDSERQCVGP